VYDIVSFANIEYLLACFTIHVGAFWPAHLTSALSGLLIAVGLQRRVVILRLHGFGLGRKVLR
jgi:hypothetical protein